MALPRQFFAPSFRHRRLGAYLALSVGIMVYVAVLVTAAEASLSAIALAGHRDLESRLTVEIPAVNEEASLSQSERVKLALSILRAIPGVTRAAPVRDDEAARLLEPWIGDPDLLKSLSVPSLIDVERKPGSALGAEDIRQQLKTSLRDAHVEDHGAWLADLARFADGLAAFGGLMIALSGLALILIVSLLCRAIMTTEGETIALLHIMGAEDGDIACHFADHARRVCVRASGAGFALALASAALLFFAMRHFADAASLHSAHWIALGSAVLAMPLLAVWIASLSARLSVLHLLKAMP
jgi:cell division transport system permease protein